MSWLAVISAMSKSGTQSGSGASNTLGIDGKVTSGTSSGSNTGNMGLLSNAMGSKGGDAAKSNADAGYANPNGANYQDATKMTNPYAFYGGETCDQIRKMSPVNIVGEKQILSKNEKCFYNNVVIPRKKV